MTTVSLLDKIRAARERWDTLVAAVPHARMSEPGLEGAWSLKDVIAHISFYEHWITDQLYGVQRGETQMVISDWVPAAANTADMHQRNAVVFEHNHARSLDDVLAEAQATFVAMVEAVAMLSDEQLNATLPWTRGEPLWDAIGGEAFEHYAAHIPPLVAWLEAQGLAVPITF